MRKLLLASAAVAAGSLGLAATAHAQFANVNQTPPTRLLPSAPPPPARQPVRAASPFA
jgi:hypothetical protein